MAYDKSLSRFGFGISIFISERSRVVNSRPHSHLHGEQHRPQDVVGTPDFSLAIYLSWTNSWTKVVAVQRVHRLSTMHHESYHELHHGTKLRTQLLKLLRLTVYVFLSRVSSYPYSLHNASSYAMTVRIAVRMTSCPLSGWNLRGGGTAGRWSDIMLPRVTAGSPSGHPTLFEAPKQLPGRSSGTHAWPWKPARSRSIALDGVPGNSLRGPEIDRIFNPARNY